MSADSKFSSDPGGAIAPKRKVVLYIAMSLDGYIAKADDDLGFLSLVEKEGEDYGYSDFIKTVDTVIIGRRTYEKVLGMVPDFPHGDKETYVVTRTPGSPIGSVNFYGGSLSWLIRCLKNKNGKNIFVDGGAQIVHGLLSENLIDELIISVIPVLLGDGIPLFKGGRPEVELKLIRSVYFEKGLVQLHYSCANN